MFAEILWENSLRLILNWGIWLLAPLLVDVAAAVNCFWGLYFHSKKEKQLLNPVTLEYQPYITVIVPVYNSEKTLYKCLKSIYMQSYPREKIEVICVNNGSRDNSFDVFQRFQIAHPELLVAWKSLDRASKSIALNAGIYSGHGAYIVNVDADTWLDKDALLKVVQTFEGDSKLAAATGFIRVDKELGKGSSFMDIINFCEVIEYMIAFNIGRRYQNIKNILFTLSGAFSAFRRDVLMQSFMYQERTVSEDTDLTFQIKKTFKNKKYRVGCVLDAVAYVEPVRSLASLYSQRARWQRGEIETIAIHSAASKGIAIKVWDYLGRMFVSDHTLALSRLSWTFLIFFLYFIGYALQTVFFSLAVLLFCYIILDAVSLLFYYRAIPEVYREGLKKIWWILFFLPFFRFLVYWFRLAGIILVLTEPQSWRVENPVIQLKEMVRSYHISLKTMFFSPGKTKKKQRWKMG
jgi:putative glycosyltransferase (exosortase G-associated)